MDAILSVALALHPRQLPAVATILVVEASHRFPASGIAASRRFAVTGRAMQVKILALALPIAARLRPVRPLVRTESVMTVTAT